MSMNTGGPAFPYYDNLEDGSVSEHGMTLRDYFAGQCLSGIVSNLDENDDPADAARAAYVMADAMIRERDEHE